MTLEKLKEIHDRIVDKYAEIFQYKARATFYGVEPDPQYIKEKENNIKELEKLIKTEQYEKKN